MRFAFIQVEKAQFGVARLCRALLVSCAGYYAWCLRPKSAHAVQDEKLKVLVNAAHTVEGRTYYGSPRVHRSLTKQGVPVSRKRIVW